MTHYPLYAHNLSLVGVCVKRIGTVRLSIMERMKERASATVLAEMEPGEARAVTLELARRRDLALPAN